MIVTKIFYIIIGWVIKKVRNILYGEYKEKCNLTIYAKYVIKDIKKM